MTQRSSERAWLVRAKEEFMGAILGSLTRRRYPPLGGASGPAFVVAPARIGALSRDRAVRDVPVGGARIHAHDPDGYAAGASGSRSPAMNAAMSEMVG